VTIRREHQSTFPRGRIPETLLMFIRLRGGKRIGVNPAFVYAPLADFYELSEEARRLSLADYYADQSGPGSAWNSEVNSAVKSLRKDGYVTVVATRSGGPAWCLTPQGVERADFWLKRMIDKSAALTSLKVDDRLAARDTGAEPRATSRANGEAIRFKSGDDL
jgi:hypothetical protein